MSLGSFRSLGSLWSFCRFELGNPMQISEHHAYAREKAAIAIQYAIRRYWKRHECLLPDNKLALLSRLAQKQFNRQPNDPIKFSNAVNSDTKGNLLILM